MRAISPLIYIIILYIHPPLDDNRWHASRIARRIRIQSYTYYIYYHTYVPMRAATRIVLATILASTLSSSA